MAGAVCYRVGLVGCGRMGEVIANALAEGKVEGCRLVGVTGRNPEKVDAFAKCHGCTGADSIEALLALSPDYVIEVATAEALKQCALPVLSAGKTLICLSMGALFDEAFAGQVRQAALEHGGRLVLASGVIGGLDVMTAAAMCGDLQATVIKRKPSSQSESCPPPLRSLPDEFEGSAREGFQLSPAHLNIILAGATACGGLDNTRFRLELVPDGERLSFGLEAEGDFGAAKVDIRPGGKLQSSGLAAWSALAALKRLTAPITW